MTPSQQIIANIYQQIQKLIFDFYLVAADAARDAADTDREEALKWLFEHKRYPQVSPESGYRNANWGWCLSSQPPFQQSALGELNAIPLVGRVDHNFWETFEAAIEAFIEAWPKIKPKREHEFNNDYLCVHCGLTKIAVANWNLLCEGESKFLSLEEAKKEFVPNYTDSNPKFGNANGKF